MISNRKELKALYALEAETMNLRVDVFSDGPVSAEIAIIGEGPGESEMRQELPFVGGSGNLLWREARPYGIQRHTVYVTNVVKRQISISSQGNARHTVGREELSKWITLLRWELAQLPNLRYVFAMGNYALEAVAGGSGIRDWRGSMFDVDLDGRKVRVVAAYNPAYILREPKLEPVFKMDLHKFNRVVTETWKKHEVNCIINPSLREIHSYINKLASDGRPVSLDIETPANEVACIGLSNDPYEAMCINLRSQKENRFTIQEEISIWQALQEKSKLLKIVAQNGIFDSYYCWLKAFYKFKCSFDTMLAHHLLFPQLPHDLGFIVTQYTTHPFYKDEKRKWREGGDIDAFWRYNCKDAALTYACMTALERDLKKHKLDKFFYEHVMRLQPHLVQATVHGIRADVEKKERLKEELSEDVQKIKARFHTLVQEATDDEQYFPNPNSRPQLAELLFTKLKLRGRGTSTDKANRDRMVADERTGPAAKEILTTLNLYKKEAKFLSTYVDMRLDKDGRFRTVYKQHGVSRAPGRLSSASTIDDTGGNLQNIPQRAYDMFLADPGTVFIYLDASQAEARVVGWYYEIEQWMEDFECARLDGKFDAHRSLCAQMFKIPYDATPTEDFDEEHNPTKRYIAKRCRHGLNYRMQSFRLSEVTKLPYFEARRAYQLYHALTPELRRGWAKVEELARRTRTLVNAYGRPWKVLQRIDDTVLESIIAFYPQSTIGDHVSRAWYMSEEDDEWPRRQARIAMNNHDALIGIATPKYAMKALSIMKKHMENPITVTNLYNTKTRQLIVPAECKISKPDQEGIHRWSGLEKVKV